MKPSAGASLPAAIEVVSEPDRILYRLPRRALGRWRFVSWVGFGIGGFILYQSASVVRGFVRGLNQPWGWTEAGTLAVMALVGVGFAYFPLGLAGAIAWGRREIELRGGKLRTTERVGPFWRTKRWKFANIERISVVGVSSDESWEPPQIIQQLDALVGETTANKRFMIAPGFPRELLGPLAAELAKQCEKLFESTTGEELTPIRVVVPGKPGAGKQRASAANADRLSANDERELHEDFDDDDQDSDDEDEASEPAGASLPADSAIRAESSASGVTLTIPPAGIWKGSKGLFFFGLIWCGFLTVVTSLVVAAPQANQQKDVWPMLGFLGLFWLVGAGLLLSAINMGRRRAVLAVVHGELMLLQTSIYRSKSRTWGAGEVATVIVGPSGMEVNDRPIVELQIHSAAGDKFGLLAGRDERELQWLAQELQKTLQVDNASASAAADAIMARDVDQQPAASKSLFEPLPQGFAITMPPAGILRGSHGFVNLGLVMCAVMGGILTAQIYYRMRPLEHPIATFITLGAWAASIAILCSGLNIGLRRAAIAASHGRLMISQSSLFGAKRREYEAGEIAAVRAAPSGAGKDFEGLVELQIIATRGDKANYLCGADKHELLWIATLLRRHLNVPSKPLPADEALEDATGADDS